MLVDIGGGVDQERCITIPRQIGFRPEATRTRWVDNQTVVRVQQTGDRLEVACTRYLGDNLDTRAIHPSQWEMTKRQRTGNRLMASGIRRGDFDLKAEINLYLKRGRKMGKSMITASTQQTDFGLMAVWQRTIMLRVVAEQRTNTYPQVISTADRL